MNVDADRLSAEIPSTNSGEEPGGRSLEGSSIDQMFVPQQGSYGAYGGRYASELLAPALDELGRALLEVVPTPEFQTDLQRELREWAGRPTPLTKVENFSREVGLDVWLKREDLLHGGAHKTNNVIGQGLLARALGKRRIVAETGAGQHGVATALAAARLGLEAVIYMGATDMARQHINVRTMRLCGATVVPVTAGKATLKEAVGEAMRDWTASFADTHFALGSVCGPDPFPRLVETFQSVIGREAKQQFSDQAGGTPDAVVACVGGGSNAIGLFSEFLDDSEIGVFGVEAGGTGRTPGKHGAPLALGRPGLLHGARSYVLQDADGQVEDAHSIAAGLDYPSVGPVHAALKDSGRAMYTTVGDHEAVEAFERLSVCEGIVPAFESSHALAFLRRAVRDGSLRPGSRVIANLSGRGQKDLASYFDRIADEAAEGTAAEVKR